MTSEPIIVIGAHRSGTTWLGDTLGRSKDVAYWVEPRHVWSYGNWFLPDDLLTRGHARESVKRCIRKRFTRFVQRSQANRLCEKTPSNCLRIPFIREVFPDAKLIILFRDGRAVFRSTQAMLKTGIGWDRVRQRLRETSIWDLPAFADRIPWMWRKLIGKPLDFWGVRPPGWRVWVREDTPNVIRAKQWAGCVQGILDSIEHTTDRNVHVTRYEDLMSREDAVRSLVDFCGFTDSDAVLDQMQASADPSRRNAWQNEIGANALDEIRPHMEHLLNRLGYHW